jgi:hypothetical protein
MRRWLSRRQTLVCTRLAAEGIQEKASTSLMLALWPVIHGIGSSARFGMRNYDGISWFGAA